MESSEQGDSSRHQPERQDTAAYEIKEPTAQANSPSDNMSVASKMDALKLQEQDSIPKAETPNGHEETVDDSTKANEGGNQGRSKGEGEGQEAAKEEIFQKPEVGDPDAPVMGKKKKKKSKPKNPKPKPTGFEEYFVDVPVKPDEYDEEKKLYDPSKPITERLQIAVQKYHSRRKFDHLRKQVFDKYMAYGRMKSGPNPFTGGHSEKDPSLTADDIARLKAQHFFEGDVEETSDVNFNLVAKGFLSSYLPQVIDLHQQQDISIAVGLVKNFLNYLHHHDVVPDYRHQLEDAKKTCDLAEGQLWLCVQTSKALPGKFNEACSVLWGGFYQDIYPASLEDAKALDVYPAVTLEDAKKIFISGLAAQGSEEMMKKYNKQMANKTYRIIRKFEGFFEVDEIIKANEWVKMMYSHPISGGFPRVGKIKAKTWYNPGGPPQDLTKAQEEEIKKNGRPIEHYEFIVEDEVLLKMFPGIKIQATIYETSFGVFYFDSITSVLCSFYTYLLNEDLIDWKPHRFLPQRDTVEAEDGPVEAHIVGERPKEPQDVFSMYRPPAYTEFKGGDGEEGDSW